MPSYLRGPGNERIILTFVRCNPYFYYGFKTKDIALNEGITREDLTNNLGHLNFIDAYDAIGSVLVTGANSPKPPRVTQRLPFRGNSAKQSISTYCGYDKIAFARAAGWTIAHPGRAVNMVPYEMGRRSLTAVAFVPGYEIVYNAFWQRTEFPSIAYAFSMNRADFDIAAPDLELYSSQNITEAEKLRLATGMVLTRPGQAVRDDSGGTLTSFYSGTRENVPTTSGWMVISDPRVEFPKELTHFPST